MKNIVVNQEWLNRKKKKYTRYPVPKWVLFCETMLNNNLQVELYPAKSTVSKYVYVGNGTRWVKVRFSNHPPNKSLEENGDADYYVGVSNSGVSTTEDVIIKVCENLGVKSES